jgi:phosphoserine phosphatase
MVTLRKTAFFDLDDTIIHGSAGLELARILSEADKDGKWQDFWEKQKLFDNKNTSFDDVIKILSICFARGIKGEKISTVQEAVEKLKPRIKIIDGFPDFYDWLLKEGFEIFVVTASPIEVSSAIPFQFTEFHGLILERNNKYTGCCSLIMTTEEKKSIINRKSHDSSFSFGVTDSVHDLPAYNELDNKFLLDEKYDKNNSVVVKNYSQIKTRICNQLDKSFSEITNENGF